MATLDARITDLEQRADMADTGLVLHIIEYVEPGQLDRPLDTLRLQHGSKAWQRTDGETEADFIDRVRADLAQQEHCGPVLLLANADDEALST